MHPQANILLVDDIPANLLALEQTLKSSELKIYKASSGNEALSLVLDHEFACILMDVQMPSMNGFEAAEILQKDKDTRDIPIIFVTAVHRDESYKLAGYQVGAVDYLYKPINPSIVKSKVSVFAKLHKQQKALKVTAQQLQQSNKNLEQFSYIASHDLQEPLRKVSTFSDLLNDHFGSELDDDASLYLHEISKAVRRMSNLIKSLLSFSRANSNEYKKEMVNYNSLISKVVSDLSVLIKEKNAVIKWNNLPNVTSVKILMGQVFQNLICNGLKYCTAEPPIIHIQAHKDKSNWIFSIKDNGIGIDKKHQEKIFGIFQRLHSRDKYEGTGIGLSLCQRIINRHDGKIWAESSPEKGSTFFFSLPDLEANL